MKTIELRHNPFKVETVVTIDGREAQFAWAKDFTTKLNMVLEIGGTR
jgi:hypothetical protein